MVNIIDPVNYHGSLIIKILYTFIRDSSNNFTLKVVYGRSTSAITLNTTVLTNVRSIMLIT